MPRAKKSTPKSTPRGRGRKKNRKGNSTPTSWSTRKTVTDDDPRYTLAAVTAITHELALPKSMRAEKFTIEESQDTTIQMRVRRIKTELEDRLESKLKKRLKINLQELVDDDEDSVSPVESAVVLPKRRRSLSPLTSSLNSNSNNPSAGSSGANASAGSSGANASAGSSGAIATKDPEKKRPKKSLSTAATVDLSDSSDSYHWKLSELENENSTPAKNGSLGKENSTPAKNGSLGKENSTPAKNGSTAAKNDSTASTKKSSKNGSTASTKKSTKAVSTNNNQPKVYVTRPTAKQAHHHRRNKMIEKNNKNAAFKEAVERVIIERLKDDKDPTKRGSRLVTEEVNDEFGTSLCFQTVSKAVAKGRVGTSPGKPGPNAGFLPNVRSFKLLCQAFETYQQINQINGEGTLNQPSRLIHIVNNVVKTCTSNSLYLRLREETALTFNAKVECTAEERRVRWTTYSNLKLWFDKWKTSLEELGFGTTAPDGQFHIPPSQLRRIINLDETSISLDGSEGKAGGRPAVTFMDPNLPHVGKQTHKTSVSTTMVTGSTAYGEPLPPHFQFSTRAQKKSLQKVRMEMAPYLKQVRAAFGNRDKDGNYEEKLWQCHFGMNEKGGMDETEFALYMENIMKLYPDAKDVKGYRVMVKVDSGPGRVNTTMLATLRTNGFYLYTGVPNSTAVTQETDVSYGPFKTKVRKNLEIFTQGRLEDELPVNISTWLIGLIIFGGMDPHHLRKTKIELDDAFAYAFTNEKNKRAWEKVGAAPLTMACLQSDKVRHEVAPGDPMAAKLREIEAKNHLACDLLTGVHKYEGELLRADIKKSAIAKKTAVTVPHTKERIDALSKCVKAGDRFLVTGGEHLSTDDAFKAAEKANRDAKIDALEKNKALRQAAERRETAALKILQAEPAKKIEKLVSTELKTLLLFYGVPSKEHGNVAAMRSKYSELKEQNAKPVSYMKWTHEEEERLQELKQKEIELKDTELGRQWQKKINEAENTLDGMDPMERINLLKKYSVEEAVEEEVREVTQTEEV